MNASIEKYLKAYNWTQWLGWLSASCLLMSGSSGAFWVLSAFQLLALAEIFHAYKKWSSTTVALCAAQTGARIYMLIWMYILVIEGNAATDTITKTIAYIMLYCWCLAEIIRYGYYLFRDSDVWKWCRYNAFRLLYPVGVSCELFLLYVVFSRTAELWIKILMIITLAAYIIAFPKLYLHLQKQRKQKL